MNDAVENQATLIGFEHVTHRLRFTKMVRTSLLRYLSPERSSLHVADMHIVRARIVIAIAKGLYSHCLSENNV